MYLISQETKIKNNDADSRSKKVSTFMRFENSILRPDIISSHNNEVAPPARSSHPRPMIEAEAYSADAKSMAEMYIDPKGVTNMSFKNDISDGTYSDLESSYNEPGWNCYETLDCL